MPTTGRVVSVSLRLTTAANAAPITLTVTAINDGTPAWTETGITASNAPGVAAGTRTGGYDGLAEAAARITVPLDGAASHGWLHRTQNPLRPVPMGTSKISKATQQYLRENPMGLEDDDT